MDFETATDLELEQALACLVYKCDGWELSKTGGSFHSCGIDGSASYVQPIPKYCTDWNATMPLAVENGVYYYPSKNGFEGRLFINSDNFGHRYQCKSTCQKPLRAMVICLIKVLEAKHERT
ncbi:hypothetical protein ABC295_000967 [Vibrio cholerae]